MMRHKLALMHIAHTEFARTLEQPGQKGTRSLKFITLNFLWLSLRPVATFSYQFDRKAKTRLLLHFRPPPLSVSGLIKKRFNFLLSGQRFLCVSLKNPIASGHDFLSTARVYSITYYQPGAAEMGIELWVLFDGRGIGMGIHDWVVPCTQLRYIPGGHHDFRRPTSQARAVRNCILRKA